jgi:hypothetical protein
MTRRSQLLAAAMRNQCMNVEDKMNEGDGPATDKQQPKARADRSVEWGGGRPRKLFLLQRPSNFLFLEPSLSLPTRFPNTNRHYKHDDPGSG